MQYVIGEPRTWTEDTACVDACPVDCIHPKKNTSYQDGRPSLDEVPQLCMDPVERIDRGRLRAGPPSRRSLRWMICRRSGSSTQN
jgi:hypothetical protein